ncbi:HoxN/HupN/NixA family nickel/cobalt transporter [Pelagibacterium lentulum]|uniref:ABC-type nickel/cobalt efflux system, permease component RcnA n=1 Tax=Pelagibacterium lentulum TaxID=2029865 RepID=A0A916RK00_9HYPH|nr:DUF1007 family protein [Pelagibacterium lentulum]GGA58931.1 hypothetical protein GCM10011499_31300 [Pelagibacterium lentulum]
MPQGFFARFLALLLVLVSGLGLAVPAKAHPHIWIDARGDFLFEDGALAAIRHHWTFDPYFSAWAIQGLDADGDGILTPEELQPLADENIIGLDYYSYYTFSGRDQEELGFAGAYEPSMVYEGGQVTLTFTVRLDRPRTIGRSYDISVGDPEYYAAFTFDEDNPITLVGAPDGCVANVSPPRPVSPEIEEQLFMLGPEVTELPDELRDAARDLANLVTLSCPVGPATTAIDAIEEVTSSGPVRPPFVAPPVEPSIAPNTGGLLGWIGQQQQHFYRALTAALSALHEDNNAFWVLGGLSFLYGVFHAAGPGHGKVVISSYILANERQLRRGIVLSFLSAMMQSLVAIGFVTIAAGALRLTSMAMSDTANWMAIGSYGLVALLGAWLAARKILGFGHAHGHVHEPALATATAGAGGHAGHGHHHHHDHHHGHDGACSHHVVLPEQTKGDWRSALGVIVSVGLRPCSGALVVLVFALTQDLLAAGILATFMMGIGTAITVAALASLAVGAKGLAARFSGGGAMADRVLWWVELAAALVVMGFGLLLLFAALG